MDFPDSTSTTSSLSNDTVSDVTESLSQVAFIPPDEEQKTITDLPSEMILRIYELLDSPSQITSLNRTSRMCHEVWRMNAASISGEVLPRSITGYISALELYEVEERLKQIHCIILPQLATLKRVRIAQKQARGAFQQGRRSERWDHVSKDAFYHSILHRNNQLLSAASDACHLLKLIEEQVVYRGRKPELEYIIPCSNDIILGYYELTILIRLRSLKAMKDRLKTMCKRQIRKMLYVATYLVCDCPDTDKIRLGISRRVVLRSTPWSWVVDHWDSDSRPRCQMMVPARRAFYAVANAVGETRIPDNLVENRSGCHGDCEEVEKTESK